MWTDTVDRHRQTDRQSDRRRVGSVWTDTVDRHRQTDRQTDRG